MRAPHQRNIDRTELYNLKCKLENLARKGQEIGLLHILPRKSTQEVLQDVSHDYGVPLRSKYPDSEMLFQKQNISRDLQNMMRKLYFIDPEQKKFEFHFSIIRLPMEKKNSRSKNR